jgi:hypothetical protein
VFYELVEDRHQDAGGPASVPVPMFSPVATAATPKPLPVAESKPAPEPNLDARHDVSVPPSLAFFCCPDFPVPLRSQDVSVPRSFTFFRCADLFRPSTLDRT